MFVPAAHRESRNIAFAIGKVRGSFERMGSGAAGAQGSQDIQGYVCSAAHMSREMLHLLLAKCVGANKE